LSALSPFDVLYDEAIGEALPLPRELAQIYGRLAMPGPAERSYVFGNVVETLDGVVALGGPGPTGGAEISGRNAHDLVLIGLLRAVSDAIVVGAGTLRAIPRHRWDPASTYRALAARFGALREAMGKTGAPLVVVVSASGAIDLSLPTFNMGTPWLVATTRGGSQRLGAPGANGKIVVAAESGEISAEAILFAIEEQIGHGRVLVEGGPTVFATFFAARLIRELFITVAPQLAGRDGQTERPGLISGVSLAPNHPLWGTLLSVRRDNSHLFLRYGFPPVL